MDAVGGGETSLEEARKAATDGCHNVGVVLQVKIVTLAHNLWGKQRLDIN